MKRITSILASIGEVITSKDARKSALHALETAVCLIVSLLVLRALGMETEGKTLIGGIILAGIAKFARESANIPVPDYVNGPAAPAKKK